MLAFVLPSVLALALACLVLRYSKPNASRLSERHERLMVAVQIICGDCSGDDARPLRTCLDSTGRKCEQCGGTSYTLASSLAVKTGHRFAAGFTGTAKGQRSARVLSFEGARANGDLRSAKLA